MKMALRCWIVGLLLSTSCHATNTWVCADQVQPPPGYFGNALCEFEKTSIPTGWLVRHISTNVRIVFVYDPDHKWRTA